MKHIHTVLVILLVSICLFSGTALAGVFSVDVSNKSLSSEDIITVPVTVSAAEKLGGYKIYVYNFDSDVQITINSSQPINGNWDVNSGISRQYQIVSFTVTDTVGLTGDYTLFSIDVRPLNSQISTIPINISVREVYNVNAVDVTDDYTWENGLITIQPGTPDSCTISFDANGGTGSLSPIIGSSGKSYDLPECTFTAPKGKVFKAWLIGSTEYQPGDYYTPSSSVTAKALWIDAVGAPGEFAVICPGPGSIIPSTDSFTVNWTAASGALGYKFSLRDRTISETEDTGKLINNEDIGNVLNYTIQFDYLISGHDYRLAVCAYNDAGEVWEEVEFSIAPTECLHLNTTKQSIARNGISEDFPMDAGDGTHYWYVNEVCDDCKTVLQENVMGIAPHNADTLSKNGVCECNYHTITVGLSKTMYAIEDTNTYLVPEASDGYHGGSIDKGEEVTVLAERPGADSSWSLITYSVTGTSREKVRFVGSSILSESVEKPSDITVKHFMTTTSTDLKYSVNIVWSSIDTRGYRFSLYDVTDNLQVIEFTDVGMDNHYLIPSYRLTEGHKYQASVCAYNNIGEAQVDYTFTYFETVGIQFTSDVNNGKSTDGLYFTLTEHTNVFSVGYSDDLFSTTNTVYNHDLAKLSLGLSAAAFTASETEYTESSPYSGRERNLANAYKKMGFSNVEYYNYDIGLGDSHNKAAYSIARKDVIIDGKSVSIYSIAIRGKGYGAEWASNFDFGTGLHATGFSEPADDIYLNLKSKLSESEPNSEVKIWITGFGRGGAIANLLAAKLDRETSALNIDTDGIYAYTFATMQCVDTTHEEYINDKNTYSNIFNIVNPSDVFSSLPFTSWGYGRYGTTYYFDYTQMTTHFSEVISEKFSSLVDDYASYIPVNQEVAVSVLDFRMGQIFDSKSLYSSIHSDYIKSLAEILFYKQNGDLLGIFSLPSHIEKRYLGGSGAVETAKDIVENHPSYSESVDEFRYTGHLILNRIGENEQVMLDFSFLLFNAIPFLTDLDADNQGTQNIVETTIGVGKAAYFIIELVQGVVDFGSLATIVTNSHIVDEIAGPLAATAYAGEKVTEFANDSALQDLLLLVIDAAFDLCGNIIDIIFNSNTLVGLIAIGELNGHHVSTSMDEFSKLYEIMNTFVSLSYSGANIASMPKQNYVEVYMSWLLAGEEVYPAGSINKMYTTDLATLQAIKQMLVDVTVVADGCGTVHGSQTTVAGGTVILEAYPDYGHEFTGWYDTTGTLLSTKFVYTTVINNDETYYAKFKHGYPIEYDLDGGTNDPNNPSRYYVTDSDITLHAPSKASDGKVHYIFDGWTWDEQNKPIKEVVIKSGSSGKKNYKAHWISMVTSINGQATVPEHNDLTIDVPNLGDEYRVQVSKTPSLSPLGGTTGNKPFGKIQELDITTTIPPSQIGVATITFSLDKTDLPTVIKPTDISLYHKEDGKWVQLPTTYIKSDADKYWYSAETNGFSPFAIGYELDDVFAILSPEANQELTTTSQLEVSWSESSGALGYTITLRDNGLTGAGSSETVIDAVDVGTSLNYIIPSSYLINGHEYQIIISAYNSTGSISTESVFSIAMASLIQEITNTTATFNAVTAAEVSYTISPDNIGSIHAPVLTKGGLTLTINDVTVEKIIGSTSTKVSAEVLANGEVSVTGDISDAESLKVSFMGRKLGDVTNDGKPDTLDAARVLQASVGLYDFSGADTFYGDVSGDGYANTLDAARILQYSVNLVDENYVTKA